MRSSGLERSSYIVIDRYVTRRGGIRFTADSAFCFNLLLTEAEITAACGYAYGAALTAQRFFKIV